MVGIASPRSWHCLSFLLVIFLPVLDFSPARAQSAGAEAESAELKLPALLEQIHFRAIGPTRQGGRVVTFAVDPIDPNRFFVGAGPGGLYETRNGGHSFEVRFEKGGVGSIGDVSIAPSDPSVVWLGTGEANLRNSTYYGDGVYRSIDGGSTWQHRGLEKTHHIGRVLVHPRSAQTVWVAAQGPLYRESPADAASSSSERGLFKTVDGGESWRNVLSPVVDGRTIGFTEVIADPSSPEILWAASYDRRRFAWSFRTAGPGSAIYKSTDGGESWKKSTRGLPAGHLGKIGLDVFRGDGYEPSRRILYATIDNQNSPEVSEDQRWAELERGLPPSEQPIGHQIYRSDDGGESWRKVSPEGRSIGNRSNYYGQIIVAPDDPERVFVLSSGCDESRDGGRTWSRCFRFGGDNHVLHIDSERPSRWLLGYDYGMAITNDGGENWYHPDELSWAQVYAVSADDARPYNVYVGLQDFGSWRGPSTLEGRFPIRFEDWQHMNGGDGMENLVDPQDSRWLFSSSQFGDLTLVDQRTGQRQSITPESGDASPLRFNWKAPIGFSPHRKGVFYLGAERLLETRDRGTTWLPISPDLTTADRSRMRGIGAVQYSTTTAIAESPLHPGELWVGTDDGQVQVSRDGGRSWSSLNRRFPISARRSEVGKESVQLLWVNRIVPSRHDSGTVWVVLSAFYQGDWSPLVFRSRDRGESWSRVTSGLPAATVNVVRESPRRPGLLFAGHDQGVSVSLDDGDTWTGLRCDLPTIPVHDLVVHERERDLIVGTHGRGVYIAKISWLEQWTDSLLESDLHLFEPEPAVQWLMESQPARSAQNFAGENEPWGVAIDYLLGEERSPGSVSLVLRQGEQEIQRLRGASSPGLHTFLWGMTRVVSRNEQEKQDWDAEQAELSADEEFFDYYDTVEQFARQGEEVDRQGRSLGTRVHRPAGETDREVKYLRVGAGVYSVTLEIDGVAEQTRVVQLLSDPMRSPSGRASDVE